METNSQSVNDIENLKSENLPDIPLPEFRIFALKEHQPLFKDSDNKSFWKEDWHDYHEHAEFFKSLTQSGIQFKETEYEGEPSYLGIIPDGTNFRASYYIGAAWLAPPGTADAKTHKAIIVTPKMQNIDFIELFLASLKCTSATNYFSKFYGIEFTQPAIQTDAFDNVLSPLLLIHFVCLMEKILRRGLKKGFVQQEENLKSKVKGRILISKNIQKNLCIQRQERIFCDYQEWTADTVENRLLKKALHFSQQMLKTMNTESHPKLKKVSRTIARMIPAFENISNEIQIVQVRQIKANKCWREYSEAIKTAQLILRRFEYSIEKAGQKQTAVPPFWIDMSRLYEMYVYSKLTKAYGNEIGFQVNGHCKTAADFIKKDERLVMDAKYKTQYNNSNIDIDDIRQISSYARDTKILQALGEEQNATEEIKCLIIFPEQYQSDFESTCEKTKGSVSFTEPVDFFPNEKLLDRATRIPSFRGFYKLKVPLPTRLSAASSIGKDTERILSNNGKRT